MDPFQEKVVLLVIDKGLLAIAGGLVAFIAARALERYRRQQSVVLELGKLRAQAFTRLLGAISAYALHIDEFLAVAHKIDIKHPSVEKHTQATMAAASTLREIALKEGALIDRETGELINEFLTAAHPPSVERINAGPFSESELKERQARIRALRERLRRYLPPLPIPD
ncbi:hypothetical protein [Myxococcus sp. AS-1-15]|jgi:hypothetical protein|uniref:hypothetical protein n=1 Tax=Myxococcus sp. AS-1-15 TaxID=2874600 RepID=UPI001CC00783|nr:hypothetical protein [Myxococcus sp. AS-1-15]MBZ4402443.1 hypothetical protein [Myxococcus sp. AS-1-15]